MKKIKNKTIVLNTRITAQDYKLLKEISLSKEKRPSEYIRDLILKEIQSIKALTN